MPSPAVITVEKSGNFLAPRYYLHGPTFLFEEVLDASDARWDPRRGSWWVGHRRQLRQIERALKGLAERP